MNLGILSERGKFFWLVKKGQRMKVMCFKKSATNQVAFFKFRGQNANIAKVCVCT